MISRHYMELTRIGTRRVSRDSHNTFGVRARTIIVVVYMNRGVGAVRRIRLE